MIFFTADYHFAHANIIRYCDRPFQNTGEMDSEIIRRHNQRVRPEDEVFFLGDYVFKGAAEQYASRLNGKFTYIKGNHDKKTFKKANSWLFYKPFMDITFTLFLIHQYSPLEWDVDITNFANAANVILCAHSHDHWKFKRHTVSFTHSIPVINVGVDVWHFYPVSLRRIMSIVGKEKA